MSHFTVLVIGDKPEKQLAPYNEEIEVPEYKEELVSEEEKKSFLDVYTIFDEKRDYAKLSKEQAKENKKLSFEELYKKYGEDWNGSEWRKDENNQWAKYSTYNPKSKWDYYSLGGRWNGFFKLKEEFRNEGIVGEKRWDNDFPEMMTADQAKKGHLDFSLDKKEYKKAIRFWEIVVEDSKLKEGEEEPFNEYKKRYYTERYKDKKHYARIRASISTFAVIKDGKWYEKGSMGWWGMSSETNEDAREWEDNFYDKWIKELPNDTLLSIYDCHI